MQPIQIIIYANKIKTINTIFLSHLLQCFIFLHFFLTNLESWEESTAYYLIESFEPQK